MLRSISNVVYLRLINLICDGVSWCMLICTVSTHGFNGPLSGTIRVSRYQKGKTNLDFTEARDSEWQWHQVGRMQVCTSLQRDNHASTPPLSFYRPDALSAAQPTASKHWRHLGINHLQSFRAVVYITCCSIFVILWILSWDILAALTEVHFTHK